MESESQKDWLDDALMSRAVVAPPRAFTNSVLARVHPERYRAQPADVLIQYGVRAGQALVAFGVLQVMDPDRVSAALTTVLRTPEAGTVVAVVAICLAWVLTRQEPEGDTR